MKKPTVSLNFISNLAVILANIAISFYLTPRLLSHLGSGGFGMWMLATSVMGYFGVLRLGIGTGVVKYVSTYLGAGDREAVDRTVSTALFSYTLISVVVAAAIVVLAGPLSRFYDAGPEFAVLLRLMGLAVAMQYPEILIGSVIKAHENFVLPNAIVLLNSLVRFAVLVLLMHLGFGLAVLGFSVIVSNLAGLAAGYVALARSYPHLRLSPRLFSYPELKLLLAFGVFVLVGQLATVLITRSPQLIIGKLISLEAVGLFGIGMALMNYYLSGIGALRRLYLPRFSSMAGSSRMGELAGAFMRGSRHVAILSALVGSWLLLFGGAFLRLWFGENADPELIRILPVLTAGTMLAASSSSSGELLYGIGRQRMRALVEVTEGAAVVGLTLWLSTAYGLPGAALGTALPLFLVGGVLLPVLASRAAGVRPLIYFARTVMKPTILAAVLVAAGRAFNLAGHADSWLALAVLTLAYLAVFAGSAFLLLLEHRERGRVYRTVGRLIRAT
ncbi:MAG: oligosaccharide flippase family protein [Spirochaetota bacterium]